MILEWTEDAIEDVQNIFDFTFPESPNGARRMAERIAEVAMLLSEMPLSGRVGKVSGTREFAVTRTPYLIIYAAFDETVRILRVLHGAQQWPRAGGD